MKYHLGLVLSGGGARGFAHLGVLKAFEEHKIKPDAISGTSAGALIGAFYAAGYTADEILSIAKEVNFFSFKNFSLGKGGLFNMSSFQKICKKYFPDDSFETLKFPLYVAVTDIVMGHSLYLSSGSLSKALLASSCVPLVFKPVPYEDTFLVDGGVLNNFPTEPLEGKCKKIIGVHVNSMSTKKGHIHMRDMLDRSFHLLISNTVYSKAHRCSVFIEPPEMSRFGLFDVRPAEEIIKFSYEHTMGMMDQILKHR